MTPQIVTNGYDFTTTFLESYINAKGTDPANINNVFKFSRTWYKELEKRNSAATQAEEQRIEAEKREILDDLYLYGM